MLAPCAGVACERKRAAPLHGCAGDGRGLPRAGSLYLTFPLASPYAENAGHVGLVGTNEKRTHEVFS